MSRTKHAQSAGRRMRIGFEPSDKKSVRLYSTKRDTAFNIVVGDKPRPVLLLPLDADAVRALDTKILEILQSKFSVTQTKYEILHALGIDAAGVRGRGKGSMKIDVIIWSRGHKLMRTVSGWRQCLRALRFRDGCAYALFPSNDNYSVGFIRDPAN